MPGTPTFHAFGDDGHGVALLFHSLFELVRELPVVFDDENPHLSQFRIV